jgi:hypothetical protein
MLLVITADVNLVQSHVPHIMHFIDQIAADPEHSDAVVGASCGLIGLVTASYVARGGAVFVTLVALQLVN